MEGAIVKAVVFILQTVTGFFCLLFLLRFFMQARRVSLANQLGGFVMQLTDWIVKPLRRVIPGWGGYDWSSLIPAYLMQVVFFGGVSLLFSPSAIADPGWIPGLLWVALLGLLRTVVHMLILLIIVVSVLSWVRPHSPLAYPLQQLMGPLLAPIRKILPPISGFDLSPIVALVLLQVVLLFLPSL